MFEKKYLCNLWSRKKEFEYEEEQYYWGGGEGDSSRTYSIPDRDYDYVVRRLRTILKLNMKDERLKNERSSEKELRSLYTWQGPVPCQLTAYGILMFTIVWVWPFRLDCFFRLKLQ